MHGWGLNDLRAVLDTGAHGIRIIYSTLLVKHKELHNHYTGIRANHGRRASLVRRWRHCFQSSRLEKRINISNEIMLYFTNSCISPCFSYSSCGCTLVRYQNALYKTIKSLNAMRPVASLLVICRTYVKSSHLFLIPYSTLFIEISFVCVHIGDCCCSFLILCLFNNSYSSPTSKYIQTLQSTLQPQHFIVFIIRTNL